MTQFASLYFAELNERAFQADDCSNFFFDVINVTSQITKYVRGNSSRKPINRKVKN